MTNIRKTSVYRRIVSAGLITVSFFLLPAGCSPTVERAPGSEHPVTKSPEESSPSQSQESTAGEYDSKPFELPRLDNPHTVAPLYIGEQFEMFSGNSHSRAYYSVWDTKNPRKASVFSFESNEKIREISVPEANNRYLGNIVYLGDEALITHNSFLGPTDDLVTTYSLINVRTGEQQELSPPAGHRWSRWPEAVQAYDGAIYGMTEKLPEFTLCAVKIEPPQTTVLHCWPNLKSDRIKLGEGGLSFLAWDKDEEGDNCTQWWRISLDGTDVEQLGKPEWCDSYDAFRAGDWEVYSKVDFVISRSTGYFDGPNGERYVFPNVQTGSMLHCGDAVYWATEIKYSTEISHVAINRWPIGSKHVETVWESESPDRSIATGLCSEGLLNFHANRSKDADGNYLLRDEIYVLDADAVSSLEDPE